jgi:hypothetical protein
MILIPKDIQEYLNNSDLFDGTIEIDDIDAGSVCTDTVTGDKILYKATLIQDDLLILGGDLLEWEVNSFHSKIWLNSELLFENPSPYLLDFKDLEL